MNILREDFGLFITVSLAIILTPLLIGVLGSIFSELSIRGWIEAYKFDKNLKVGDKYVCRLPKLSDNPFEDEIEYTVTIRAIKKDSRGRTWVKYCKNDQPRVLSDMALTIFKDIKK